MNLGSVEIKSNKIAETFDLFGVKNISQDARLPYDLKVAKRLMKSSRCLLLLASICLLLLLLLRCPSFSCTLVCDANLMGLWYILMQLRGLAMCLFHVGSPLTGSFQMMCSLLFRRAGPWYPESRNWLPIVEWDITMQQQGAYMGFPEKRSRNPVRDLGKKRRV